jgi:hypothetical protein
LWLNCRNLIHSQQKRKRILLPEISTVCAACDKIIFHYIVSVNCLTKQEQLFLIIVLGLLLTGWAVKSYRTAHPATTTIQEAKP